MSHQATTWVLERSEQQGRNFIVLFVIANHCGPDGNGAFPSIERIAGQARVCEKTARTAISELEESKELVVVRTKGRTPNQEWKSRNFYSIPGVIADGFYRERAPKPAVTVTAGNQEREVKPAVKTAIASGNALPPNNPLEQKQQMQELAPVGAVCSTCGEIGVHPCNGNRRPFKPPKSKNHRTKEDSPVIQVQRADWKPDGFEIFWEAYPKKVGRIDAQKAWNDKRPISEEVLDGLKRWIFSDRWQKGGGAYIPDAWRFIDKESWKEDPNPKLERDLSYGYPRLDTKSN